MSRCAFVEPSTGVRSYWSSNYATQDSAQRHRAVATVEPTSAGWQQIVPIRIQGEDQPRVLKFGGVADATLDNLMLRMLGLSLRQSVIFEDVTGETYEVLVVAYDPSRRGVIRTRNNANHVRSYTLELQVIRQIS